MFLYISKIIIQIFESLVWEIKEKCFAMNFFRRNTGFGKSWFTAFHMENNMIINKYLLRINSVFCTQNYKSTFAPPCKFSSYLLNIYYVQHCCWELCGGQTN